MRAALTAILQDIVKQQLDSLKMSETSSSCSVAHLAPKFQPGEFSLSEDELIVKVRKPYTITKQREKWTEEEHDRFLAALKLYGRAWSRIEEYIGTKTAIQIRSHAQKFFSKVERHQSQGENYLGLGPQEIEIPPPRPKRKPNHPYPRKATTTHTPNLTATDKKGLATANSSRKTSHPNWDYVSHTNSSHREMPRISVKNFVISSERSDGSIGKPESHSRNGQKAFCESPEEQKHSHKKYNRILSEKVELTTGNGRVNDLSEDTAASVAAATVAAASAWWALQGFKINGPGSLNPCSWTLIPSVASIDADADMKKSKISSKPFIELPSSQVDFQSVRNQQGLSHTTVQDEKVDANHIGVSEEWDVDLATQVTVPDGARQATMAVNPERQGLENVTLKTLSRSLTRNEIHTASDQLAVKTGSENAEIDTSFGSCRPANEKHLKRTREAVGTESSGQCMREVIELKNVFDPSCSSTIDCKETAVNLENEFLENGLTSNGNDGKSDEPSRFSKTLCFDVSRDKISHRNELKRPKIRSDDGRRLETANGPNFPCFGSTVLRLGRDSYVEDIYEQATLPRMFAGSQIMETANRKYTSNQPFDDSESCQRKAPMKLLERNGHQTENIQYEDCLNACQPQLIMNGYKSRDTGSCLLQESRAQGDSLNTIRKDPNPAHSSIRLDNDLEISGSASEALNLYQFMEETTASSPSSVLDLATIYSQKKPTLSSANLLTTTFTAQTKKHSAVGFVPYCGPF
ncbi:hypothetical protein O6H91_01G103300 [Diphasiastrum complanatum]|uniref:Uncharacterized protein n=1 Tax=Diphasiastrum complanatum TaxID=34168 RepID=A0ACC2EU76_DIPCM|nr:hypothetical protein O6H91_01G103300 [Diphasiastrum complanatum]